jgi:hypothetical protein
MRGIIFEEVARCTAIQFEPASEHANKSADECEQRTHRCRARIFDPSDNHDQDNHSKNTDFEDTDSEDTDSEDIDSGNANLARHFDYLQTCRQVYNEAFGLIFVCNRFSYCIDDFVPESGEYKLIFLRELHLDQSRLITTLELTGSMADGIVEEDIDMLKGLKKLRLEFHWCNEQLPMSLLAELEARFDSSRVVRFTRLPLKSAKLRIILQVYSSNFGEVARMEGEIASWLNQKENFLLKKGILT